MQKQLPLSSRLLAVAGVLLVFTLVWLYTREFRVFTNTIGMRGLLWGSLLVGALAGAGMLYRLRRRLRPWDLHLPEVFTILIFSILSMPLLASLLNRAGGKVAHESFVFVSEQPYISSNYGLLKGEKIKASGYRLQVKEGQRLLRFQYKSQPYFPLSKPGDEVLLPVRRGLLGIRVMEME